MSGKELDEAGLRTLVEAFYARVRADSEIGPIFNDSVGDWPAHLETMTAFWSSVMLTTGRYKGQPVPAHLKHSARMSPAHFERWLLIWGSTADALMTSVAAAALKAKAARIAESLQLALFHRLVPHRGAPPCGGMEQRP